MGFGNTPTGTDGVPLSSAYKEADGLYAVRGQAKTTDANGNPTVAVEVAQPTGSNLHVELDGGTSLIGGVQLVDSGGTNKAAVFSGGALKVDGSAANQPVTITNIDTALDQQYQVPVSNAAPAGKLTISESSLAANTDNTVTFSATARRIRIQNESSGIIYWEPDATASTASASLAAPGSNTVSVEWVALECDVLHIWIPSGGTTILNGSGGVKVMAWP